MERRHADPVRTAALIAALLCLAASAANAEGKPEAARKNAILLDTVSAALPQSTFITNPVLTGFSILGLEYQRALGGAYALDASLFAAMQEEPIGDLARFRAGAGLGLRAMFTPTTLSGPYARLGASFIFPKSGYIIAEAALGWEFEPWPGVVLDNRVNLAYCLGAYFPVIGLDLLMVGISF